MLVIKLTETTNAYKVSIVNVKGIIQLKKSASIWEDNIKIDL
jgi:hypothetical protein